MPFLFLYLLLCMYQRFFCGYCDSQHCILVYESQNSLLKLLNISFFVYSFIILPFFILYLNYFIFVRVFCPFVKALSMFSQAWSASCLSFILILKAYPHLQRHHLNLSLRSPKRVITFPLCALWLIISYYVLTFHLLIISSSLHKQHIVLIYDHWIYRFLLIYILFLLHLVNREN